MKKIVILSFAMCAFASLCFAKPHNVLCSHCNKKVNIMMEEHKVDFMYQLTYLNDDDFNNLYGCSKEEFHIFHDGQLSLFRRLLNEESK